MKLDNLDLLKLMPRFMRSDETTAALCAAIEPELKTFHAAIAQSMPLPFLENAPEWLLDELAWEYNLTWYDTSAPLDVKRKVIQSGEYVKRHLGTVAAVEQTIADYFGDGSVEEWFQYDGEPYMFRVRTTNPEVNDEQAARFRMALNATKNVRSHLESVVIDRRASATLYVGVAYHEGEIQTMKLGGL